MTILRVVDTIHMIKKILMKNSYSKSMYYLLKKFVIEL